MKSISMSERQVRRDVFLASLSGREWSPADRYVFAELFADRLERERMSHLMTPLHPRAKRKLFLTLPPPAKPKQPKPQKMKQRAAARARKMRERIEWVWA